MQLGYSALIVLMPLLCLSQTKREEAFDLGRQGIQLVDEGNYQGGIDLLKQARNIEPANYDYALEIGRAYLLSGNAKKAERYLYDLQFHASVTDDLYMLLANCYSELEKTKKEPDEKRKKELSALKYGIEKLPHAGRLYEELGKLHLSLEDAASALAIWELGLKKAPTHAANYYWATRILDKQGNNSWAWLYGELYLNLSDDPELKRALAPIVYDNARSLLSPASSSSPEKLGQSIGIRITENCANLNSDSELSQQIEIRRCLLQNWSTLPENLDPLFEFMTLCEQNGHLDAYVAVMFSEVEKDAFLKWMAQDPRRFENFNRWHQWNSLVITRSICRVP